MIRDIFDVLADAILMHARFAIARSLYRALREAQGAAYHAETWLPGRVAGCRCDYPERGLCQQSNDDGARCSCPCHVDARDPTADPFEVRLHGERVEDASEHGGGAS